MLFIAVDHQRVMDVFKHVSPIRVLLVILASCPCQNFWARCSSPGIVFHVLQDGSSLFTTLSATRDVRVASSWPTPRARDTRLTLSGLQFLRFRLHTKNSCTTPRRHGTIRHHHGARHHVCNNTNRASFQHGLCRVLKLGSALKCMHSVTLIDSHSSYRCASLIRSVAIQDVRARQC